MASSSRKSGQRRKSAAIKKFDTDTSLGFVINRTAYMMRQHLQEEFRNQKHSTTPEEFALLRVLWKKDGRRQGELADYAFKDRTTVTRLIDGMVRKGLLVRKLDPTDRRVVCTWLTRAGKSLENKLVPIAHDLVDYSTGDVSQSDIDITLRTLKVVQANLTNSKK